jgi:hypothetical protein
MHGIGAVEPVQSGRRVVAPRDAVTRRTARASATDRREVEASRLRVRMHDIGAVEPVQSGRRVVMPRDTVTGRTTRANATDRREVERRDGASGCTA